MIHAETTRALLDALLSATLRGWAVEYRSYPGNSIIARCRNTIVSDFLASTATDLVFIDADVSWEPGALVRLCEHDVDVVAGVYPHRRDPITFPVRWKLNPDGTPPPLYAINGLLEVEGVPGGFLRIRRQALERMVAVFAHKAYESPDADTGRAVAVFDHELIDGQYYGEDFIFCKRWREIMDGKVWVDPEITLHHVGNKTFTGNLGDWLRSRMEPAVSDAA